MAGGKKYFHTFVPSSAILAGTISTSVVKEAKVYVKKKLNANFFLGEIGARLYLHVGYGRCHVVEKCRKVRRYFPPVA